MPEARGREASCPARTCHTRARERRCGSESRGGNGARCHLRGPARPGGGGGVRGDRGDSAAAGGSGEAGGDGAGGAAVRHGTARPAMEGAAAGMRRSGAQWGAAARGVPAAPGAALRAGRCGRGSAEGLRRGTGGRARGEGARQRWGGGGGGGGGVPAERTPPLRAVTASDAAPRGALAHAPLTGLRPEVPEARASPGSTMASACLKEKPPLRPPGE